MSLAIRMSPSLVQSTIYRRDLIFAPPRGYTQFTDEPTNEKILVKQA